MLYSSGIYHGFHSQNARKCLEGFPEDFFHDKKCNHVDSLQFAPFTAHG